MKTYQLRVKEVIPETADAKSLVFEIPEDLSDRFKYEAGQFIGVHANINGEHIQRSYSLASCPGVDSEFRIGVKKVFKGRMSTYLLDKIRKGDSLEIVPPAGRFTLKASESGSYIFFAAGSGITPIISLLKQALKKSETKRCHLVYSNRDEQSVIFQRELQGMLDQHGEKLKVTHVYSQPTGEAAYRGRLSAEMMDQFIDPAACDGAQSYLCGPEDYMSFIKSELVRRGVESGCVNIESFTTVAPTSMSSVPVEGLIAGDNGHDISDLENIHVTFTVNGEQTEVRVDKDENLLEAALKANLAVPYSCMEGVCFACMARLDDGRVVMPEDVALDSEEIFDDKKILACQCRILTQHAHINFDEA